MKRALLYLSIVSVAISSCSRDPIVATPATAEVRILNDAPWTFTEITVDPSGKFSGDPAFNYGQVDVSGYSGYHSFTNIYRYSWVRLKMDNKTYSLNPIDFVGETPLSAGKYTYKLIYYPATDRIDIELIKD